MAELVREDLVKAKAKHAPKRAIDVNSLAEHFLTVMQGSMVLAKTQRSPEVLEKSLTHFKNYLHILFET